MKWSEGGNLMVNCTIKDFISNSYGKYQESSVDSLFIMEYDQMFPYMTQFLPENYQARSKFMDYLATPNLIYDYAGLLMMLLPGDRAEYYRTSDIAEMRASIFDVVDTITELTGFYPIRAQTALLYQMNIYHFGLLFIGLVFDIVLILFVLISVLLIYSLLMITTETKTFDTGVMRLLGLTSYGFVAMIMT